MINNILIADDVAMNRMLIKSILKDKIENVEYFEAVNGVEVLEIVRNNQIDLIILDLIMPIKDGFDTLEELKLSFKFKHIPVIVSSALSDISNIEKTLEMGAMEYFTKPFSPDDIDIILPLKVKNVLRIHEQNKEIERLNLELNQELKNANSFAKFMLPITSNFDMVECNINYYPSLGIGGDFVDCIEQNGKVWFMIADITGHGIAAGMASSMIKIFFRMTIEKEGMTPKNLLKSINDKIFEIFEEETSTNYIVFTSFVGCIENGKLTYANAAQPYPLIYKASTNEVISIEDGGMLIGMFDNAEYDEYSMDMSIGDSIFVYTDGLFSTGFCGDYTQWSFVKESCIELKDVMKQNSEKFLESIFWKFSFIHKAAGTNFTDDVALMHITVKK